MQINILEGRAGYSLNGSRFSHYFIFILLSDNRNRKKYTNENSFIENLAASKYSTWHRAANKCNK